MQDQGGQARPTQHDSSESLGLGTDPESSHKESKYCDGS